jgi:lysophospholipase L1-like esterase
MIDRRLFIGGVALAAAPLACAAAQDAAEQRLKTDWPWLGRYADDNKRLIAARTPIDIVFLGDSITEGWRDKSLAFFTPGRINRGIGGQTTPQMLLRFRQDVVELKPRVVHIMAGTNDIAGNTGPMTIAQTQANIMSMAELARAHGISVILASVTPASHFPWRPGLNTVAPIATINAWLKGYAARTGAICADYWTALHHGNAMRSALTYDGVHPNEAGYAAMAPIAEAAIRAALARPFPDPLSSTEIDP